MKYKWRLEVKCTNYGNLFKTPSMQIPSQASFEYLNVVEFKCSMGYQICGMSSTDRSMEFTCIGEDTWMPNMISCCRMFNDFKLNYTSPSSKSSRLKAWFIRIFQSVSTTNPKAKLSTLVQGWSVTQPIRMPLTWCIRRIVTSWMTRSTITV